MRFRGALLAPLLCGSACGPVSPPGTPAPDGAPTPIVAAERGRGATVLVFVDAEGRRVADLTTIADEDEVRYRVDTHPAGSPDGRWVVFASTRGRSDEGRTSLWLIEAVPGAVPRQLTRGANDRDPAWTHDGRSIVFASDRAGTFDVWRVALAAEEAPQRLTAAPTDEVHPSVGPDGSLLYAVVDHEARSSTLWRAEATGADPQQLTAGPLDRDPVWSPQGDWIAYAAPAPGRSDLDLYRVRASGGSPHVIADEPLADERSPSWSADGRFVFAIAELRGARSGRPFFASVVHVSPDAVVPMVRALHDPVAIPRIAIAVAPAPLRAEVLANNPAYDRDAVLAALRDLCADRRDDDVEACQAIDDDDDE